ncbi:sel1 repeat family protein [Pseudomonas lundensis]|nr:sel1 repeat family protein [Pseudomonas lundensis]
MADFFVLHRMLSADAQFGLATEYASESSQKPNAALAAILLKAAAERGHRAAQFNLGCCYDNGTGVVRDEKRAVYWYLQAAKQGFMLAEYNLAYCFDNGLGVPQNSMEANRWYRKAADRGYAPAQLAIAINLEEGRGCQRSMDQAVLWYLKALSRAKLDRTLAKAVQDQVHTRALALSRYLEASQKPKPETVKCPKCGMTIRYSVMTAHMSEMHGNRPDKPKRGTHKKRRPARIVKPQPQPVITSRTSGPSITSVLPSLARSRRECLCPRCGGDGGVRGGCTKCDGTGWVAANDSREEPYRPAHSHAQANLVSNANYQGENLGAHFRDSDGRFGSLPLHDDFGDEGFS